MTLFQVGALTLLACLSGISVSNVLRRRGRLRVSVLWLAMWLVAAVMVIQPALAVRAARAVGIGRGADLVFYCNVLFTMVGLFYLYMRNRNLQRDITLLVRELAVANAARPERALPPGELPQAPAE